MNVVYTWRLIVLVCYINIFILNDKFLRQFLLGCGMEGVVLYKLIGFGIGMLILGLGMGIFDK